MAGRLSWGTIRRLPSGRYRAPWLNPDTEAPRRRRSRPRRTFISNGNDVAGTVEGHQVRRTRDTGSSAVGPCTGTYSSTLSTDHEPRHPVAPTARSGRARPRRRLWPSRRLARRPPGLSPRRPLACPTQQSLRRTSQSGPLTTHQQHQLAHRSRRQGCSDSASDRRSSMATSGPGRSGAVLVWKPAGVQHPAFPVSR